MLLLQPLQEAHLQSLANLVLLILGGTFIEGSTSEFSADAPLRDPYNIFVQGGSHIAHIKIALIRLLSELLEEKLISKDSLLPLST